MKHTLEEIEKMLSDISAWPWAAEEMGPIIWSFNGNLIVEKPEFEINLSIKSDIDIQFIKNTPEIISDLVKEVKKLEKQHSDVSNRHLVQEIELRLLAKENKRLREALELCKRWSEDDRNIELNKKINILEKALKFYGDLNNYLSTIRRSNVLEDNGVIVRKALGGI